MPVTVTLPDGNAARAARRRDRRRRRRRDRARARARRAGDRGQPPRGRRGAGGARPRPPAARRRARRDHHRHAAARRRWTLIRHDAAHVLATAVLELYHGVKISIGPAIEDGFYYDFEFPDGVAVSEDDLPAIEERDARARQGGRAVRARGRARRAGARALRRRGPGLQGRADRRPRQRRRQPSTRCETRLAVHQRPLHRPLPRPARAEHQDGQAPSSCSSVAGAYWRGDSDRTMLTRIYGTAFFSKAELEEHLERLEQARARDHRRLGRELDLFTFSELSPGRRLLEARRDGVWNALVELSRADGRRARLQRGQDAELYDAELWKPPGHWDNYREHMFTSPTSRSAQMGAQADELPRPLPCSTTTAATPTATCRCATPSRACCTATSPRACCTGCCACATSPRTTRTSSAPRSRSRTRSRGCLRVRLRPLRAVRLRAAPGALDAPREADRQRRDVGPRRGRARRARSTQQGLEYELNPGDGAFYGPKIDLHMTDSLGRSWQLGTVQLDYSMPERFDLTYTGADNAEHRPVMIHRALFGSFERFIGILIEHYGGELPLWLAPVQAIVLPVSDRFNDYAAAVTRAAARRRRCASSSTTAASRSGARSARPSCARSPTCWSSASASRATGRSSVREHARRRQHVRRASRACASELRRATCADELYSAALKPAQILTAPRLAFSLTRGQSQLVPVPRRFDRRPPERDPTRINERIRVPEVRLIDEEGNQIGVLKTPDALASPRNATSTSSRSPPRRARPSAACSTTPSTSTSRPRSRSRRASTSSRSPSARSSSARRSPSTTTTPRSTTSSASCATRTRSRSRSCSAAARSPTPSAAPRSSTASPRSSPSSASSSSARCRKGAT